MASDNNLGKLSGRHVVRIILNASPPSTPHDERRQYKSKKKFSQSTSSLDNRTSQLDPYSQTHSTSRLPSTQQVSTSEDQLEMAKEELRKVTEEKEAVEEEQGRLLALNVQMALDNKRLLEEQPKLKREMKRLEQESALWKLQEADMVRANTELIFEVIF